MITLVPSYYRGPDRPGDFAWMIEQPEHTRSLFVYNENLETHKSRDWSRAGVGNACIRPYRTKRRAIGIPTGSYVNGGFQALTQDHMDAIDQATEELYQWMTTGAYDRVIYSADETGLIGCGIFDVAKNVREYITSALRHVVERANILPKTTP